ncbi:hypothetical protein N8I77_011056 [Diaporthe amygdali]|uniref:Uncharacterized protein n=1 Tax=Phomopsis amygdali TaxID=1214568 RepID=A0AAD9VY98_PHOAM|nr:hypothetical protein N8I77_011056 [Diaporthe amygdali]
MATATAFVASTPSPGSPVSVNTPSTPRHGTFYDNYTPVRKSERLSSQRTSANRTPSPHQSSRTSTSRHVRASPKSTSDKKHQPTHATSSRMTSPPATASPQKKRLPAVSRVSSGSLTAESIRHAAAALGQSQRVDPHSLTSAPSQSAHVLPTPAKTPSRKHAEQNEKSVNAIARNLFSKPQSPKKTRTKQYKLDSFDAEDDTFQIYTDSQDRLPAADTTEENPFYGEAGIAASAKPVRRSSRNRKNTVGASVSEQVDEVVKREDGLLYVFRGKKIFRKFSDGDESSSRLDVKPRLLFPSAKSHNENELVHPDEEAETDIEQPVADELDDVKARAETPVEAKEEKVDTPKAPKFAPASPPDTSRATRSKKITNEPTPVKTKRPGNRSPFDGWRRTKTASEGSANGHKRPGEPLSGASASKRPRA